MRGPLPSAPSGQSQVLSRPLHLVVLEQENLLQRWFAKLRVPIFIFVGLLLVAGYNGKWRIGRDSSLYREVAKNLQEGKGYTYRGERQRHIYPGLPYLLAAIDRVFGKQDPLAPRAALRVMVLFAAITLVAIYQLIRVYYPRWAAVCVATGVGINAEFLSRAHELMTDLPFLCGVCLTMLGIARLPRAKTSWQQWRAVALLGAGAVISISMRPTFWALVIAWLGACFVGLIGTSRRKIWYAVGVGVLVAMVAAWLAMDPRTSNGNWLGGKYEQRAKAKLSQLWKTNGVGFGTHAELMLTKHLPEAMFGLEMPSPIGEAISLTVLVSGALLVRRGAACG